MKKLLCILNVFHNHEHIQKCFDSIYQSEYDYFILENKSKNSDKIESYFLDKDIIGYHQFQDNITHGSVDLFFKDYKDLIYEYEYITLTDGDLYIEDVQSTYKEIFKILEEPKVHVCAVDLSLENLPLQDFPESRSWIPAATVINNSYISGTSGMHLVTVKRENVNIFYSVPHIIDSAMHLEVRRRKMIWARTLKNKAYHLTWDYYHKGNEYLEWKLQNNWIQHAHNKTSEFKKII